MRDGFRSAQAELDYRWVIYWLFTCSSISYFFAGKTLGIFILWVAAATGFTFLLCDCRVLVLHLVFKINNAGPRYFK